MVARLGEVEMVAGLGEEEGYSVLELETLEIKSIGRIRVFILDG